MLTQTYKDNLMLWVKQFFANSVKCLNEYVCCGKSDCKVCEQVAKVYSLMHCIENAGTYISEIEIDNLYRRLQCLIDLKVTD